MDGYSHHDHQKRDLQVSKGKRLIHVKGNGKAKNGSKGGLIKGNTFVNVYVCITISYMLSVNNNSLCLGYK